MTGPHVLGYRAERSVTALSEPQLRSAPRGGTPWRTALEDDLSAGHCLLLAIDDLNSSTV